jgi:hypothetical protein
MSEVVLWVTLWWAAGLVPLATLWIGAWLTGEDLELGQLASAAVISLLGPVAFLLVVAVIVNEMLRDVDWSRVVIAGRKPTPSHPTEGNDE